MKKFKILIAFPDIPYYNWQILVQINNLKKFGYGEDVIYVVGKNQNNKISKQLKIVFEETKTQYFVYDDTRIDVKYPSSLRPHILKKYFKENPKISNTYLYIDPDLLFSKKIDFTPFIKGKTWYLSDTKSYIDSKYIKSKGIGLFYMMTDTVCINPYIVEENDDNAGGAQYLMKNIDDKFWEKVEKDSEDLYIKMQSTVDMYNPQHPIQSWTSDMWAVLWNAWALGHKTKIIPEFNFSWATDSIDKYENLNFFHNAGVFNQENLFNKTKYQQTPFNSDFSHVSKDFCSYKYVEEIGETKNNFPKLIKLF